MKIVILTGAGISAESGVSTFRDSDGLWENHDVMEVASIEGWHKNPVLVQNFYNQRRRQLKTVEPNEAHRLCARLEENHEVTIITQNVDDLHERASSSFIIHLHGSLLKVKNTIDDIEYDWNDDLNMGDTDKNGVQLRPAIVWFGESVPKIGIAIDEVKSCDILIIIGTSLQVYPAASLVGYAHKAKKIYLIDPLFVESYETRVISDKLITIKDIASVGMKKVINYIS